MVTYSLDKSLEAKGNGTNGLVGHNWNRQQAKKGFCSTKLADFCKRTDLHGYKYVVMEDLSVFERSFWAFAVVVSTAFAINFVITAYNWYARNPIVTVIESTQGPIWDIPFPAVTICDLNLVSRNAARVLANNVTLPENVTADEVFETLRLIPLLHSTFIVELEQKKALRRLQTVLDLNHIPIEQLFKQLSPASTCNRLVQRCMWKNTVYRCDSLFQQVFTHFSVCCTFNYFAIKLPKNDRPAGEFSQASWPRRVAACGYQTALSVLIDTHPGDYYSATVASQGALVFIDNAFNIPNIDSPVRMVSPNTEVMIALSPERTYTTPGIKAFKPQDRQCYFIDEVEVGNFRQYSFHNCLAFKRTETTRNVCECIPFFFHMNDYHRTCNFNDLDCLETILVSVNKDVNESSRTEQQGSFKCLPECEHYDYPLEVALGDLAVNAQLDGLPFFSGVSLQNRSLVNVFFNDLVSTRYRRDVYLNWQNLLASFGGLLSLMLGFTLIAGVDLIIFFTFGVFCGSYRTTLHDKNIKDKQLYANGPIGPKIFYVKEFPKKKYQTPNLTKVTEK